MQQCPSEWRGEKGSTGDNQQHAESAETVYEVSVPRLSCLAVATVCPVSLFCPACSCSSVCFLCRVPQSA